MQGAEGGGPEFGQLPAKEQFQHVKGMWLQPCQSRGLCLRAGAGCCGPDSPAQLRSSAAPQLPLPAQLPACAPRVAPGGEGRKEMILIFTSSGGPAPAQPADPRCP